MVIVVDAVTRVKILDEVECILQSANILGKGMDPIIIPPDMGKYRADWALQSWLGDQSRRRKTLNPDLLNTA